MPQQLLTYGGMIAVIAVISLLYWWKNAPVRRAADRFGLLFLEARDYAMDGWKSTPIGETDDTGRIRLQSQEQQPRTAQNALERGRSSRFARYDRELEGALMDLFQAVGTSAHLKRRYYDYFNTFFTLHKQFLQVCTDPEGTEMTQEGWDDLKAYMGDRVKVIQILMQRLSGKARREVMGRRVTGRPQPQKKEGIG